MRAKRIVLALVLLATGILRRSRLLRYAALAVLMVTAFKVFLIDMSGLTFVDSSGLGALLSCLRMMKGKNGQLLLVGMSRPVRALFELVRMHRIFSIYNSLAEALDEAKAA
jgi:anti-sigma B factor antagonist